MPVNLIISDVPLMTADNVSPSYTLTNMLM
jgi:hypothetical protein